MRRQRGRSAPGRRRRVVRRRRAVPWARGRVALQRIATRQDERPKRVEANLEPCSAMLPQVSAPSATHFFTGLQESIDEGREH